MSVLGARRDSSSVKPGLELLVQHSTSSGLAGGAEHKVGEEMLDKTNAPSELSAAFRCSAPAQCWAGTAPFSELVTELFSLMSSDSYSRCSACNLCVLTAFYSDFPQHLEGTRAGDKIGNLCFVGFPEIKTSSCLLWEF